MCLFPVKENRLRVYQNVHTSREKDTYVHPDVQMCTCGCLYVRNLYIYIFGSE